MYDAKINVQTFEILFKAAFINNVVKELTVFNNFKITS